MNASRAVAVFLGCTMGLSLLSATEASGRPSGAQLPSVTPAQLADATIRLDPSYQRHSLTVNRSVLEERRIASTERIVSLASDILFGFGSAQVRDGAGLRISALVASLPQGETLTVTGHTDSVGSPDANLALSQRRAESVATIIRRARPDLKLIVSGRGESEPVASNGAPDQDDPAGRAKNRRVELRYRA